MYHQGTLEALKRAEAEYVFSSFGLEDAHRLGELLRSKAAGELKPFAVRVVLDDLVVYQSFLPGTTENNKNWMDRKCATVEKSHKSSLRVLVERELEGAKEVWQTNEHHYAFCGGGFPIVVAGQFRGVATISGLPHLDDHRVLCQALAEFLGKPYIPTPVDEE